MISFGTGGWRAVIGDGFTRTNIQRLMRALALRIKAEDVQDKSFCIGFDRRFLSREAAQWAAEVMAGEGIHVLLISREAPTPLIMFTVQYYGLDYGIAVTASHNPALYNGIKVFTKGGRDAEEAVTNELGEAANRVQESEIHIIPYDKAVASGMVQEINPQNPYLDAIIRGVNMDAIRSRDLRIIFDPMYGVSRTSLQTILLTARCDVNVIHERHDTLFGGRLPAPNMQTLGALRATSWSSTPTWASPPTATRTAWVSSTMRAASSIPTRFWCFFTTTCSSTRAGTAPPCETSPPRTFWTAWPRPSAKPATRCRWALSTFRPACASTTPSSAARAAAA